jgi:hypothetical protein
MSAGPLALAADEVAVGGRRTSLAGRYEVAVHPDAHRTPGLPPLETGTLEDCVEALRLRLCLHHARARHHHGRNGGAAPVEHFRCGAKVFDTAVGA